MNPWPNPIALALAAPSAGIAVITPAMGAVQLARNSFNPCDTTAGQCIVQLPNTPNDLDLVILVDVSNTPGVNAIIVEAEGATTLGAITTVDPSWNGQGARYGATGRVQDNAGGAVWLVFVKSLNAWVLGN